jgi:hypothetical protein
MGIRFTCPQGHSLNVKSELAGKRGVCPQCGTAVQIPDRSEPPIAAAGAGVDTPKTGTTVQTATPQAAVVEDAWYVRPPAGGQFGPASSAEFVQWIGQGRVLPEAHVWRIGWPDWRRASDAANELPAPLPPVAPAATLPNAEPLVDSTPFTLVVPDRIPAAGHRAGRRNRSAQRQLSFAIALLVVALILGAILLWVLQREPPQTSQSPGCPPAHHVLG